MVDFVLIEINRLLELDETTEPFTAILLTRSLLLKFYLSSSYPLLILCCSVRLFFLEGLFFIYFDVDVSIIHQLDPIFDPPLSHFEYIAVLNKIESTLDFFGI